ncbi:MAG: LysE family translocator [Opitutaceae bacterium]|jgi:threonine/homoserine/homoserine lactone efflux protein|nr:LysE family translocator [Opitutaceae bacterium]
MFPQVATLLGILTVGLVSPGPDFFLVLKNSMSGSRARAFATGIGIAVGLTMQVVALSLGLAVAPPVVLRCIQLAGAGVLLWLGVRALFSRGLKKTAGTSAPRAAVGSGGKEKAAVAAPAAAATAAASVAVGTTSVAHTASSAGTTAATPTASAPAGTAPAAPAATAASATCVAADGTVRGQALAGFMEGFLCNATNVKVFVFFVSIFSQFLPAGASWQWRVAVPVIVVLHGATLWSLITAALLSPPVATRLARAQRWLPRVFGVVLLAFAAFVIREAARGAW